MGGHATEELASSVGETLGGLLNATFGNAVEMLLAGWALRDGLIGVVQGSLLGSILSNLLLVLGMCFLFGGVKFKTQSFNGEGARAQSSLLLLAVLAMVVPTICMVNMKEHEEKEKEVLHVSRMSALVLG